MTFLVFIGYGGSEAKNVAENLGMYLERIGIPTFVASSKFGSWLIPGQPRFDGHVWSRLQKSDMMVLVSTRKTAYSKKVKEEVFDTVLHEKPILVIRENGTGIPFSRKLKKSHWIPGDLCFHMEDPSQIFPEVAIHVLRNMETLAESRLQMKASEQ